MSAFERGLFPAGVTTEQWPSSNGPLTVEMWYPATEETRGRDLDPATKDRYEAVWVEAGEEPELISQDAVRDADRGDETGPLVVFSHGFMGHRREGTFLCTHLASHGYTVISTDHPTSTSWEVEAALDLSGAADDGDSGAGGVEVMIQHRRDDLKALFAHATERGLDNGRPIGFTGASLGGWTSLLAPSIGAHVHATVPMCPAGGLSPTSPTKNNAWADGLDFDWPEEVACMMLVADRDSWLPLAGQFQLLRRTPPGSSMVVLCDADHNHFVDDIEMSQGHLREVTMALADVLSDGPINWGAVAEAVAPFDELVSEAATHKLWQGLVVSHFDAHLRGDTTARTLLETDIQSTSRALGAETYVVRNL
ncbi:MAG: hypothetical protein QF367_00640 [Acidimicrobiales bacterium]|jgi:dienelactone hydrolase|uniref:Serine aminopeptidase S33 domain-containing protein n=1 Tax=marine metagenome TaxID=408172 RepID=A0A382FSC8_9ZZZZ|nr:hypothetical protein [Acidimicrobiales bacterium]MEE1565688.1 hypothetical protein [Acidimicrobiales bacterium]HJO19136.1 hypothetical protein [Acidimicrobiales bacterium]|tara:strand:- start:196 stop:1293 length:1098 start_codon:yes stop_codon:yes gene_type:complete